VIRRDITNIETSVDIEGGASMTGKFIIETVYPKYNVATDIAPPAVALKEKRN
jgi:hypothetical protein